MALLEKKLRFCRKADTPTTITGPALPLSAQRSLGSWQRQVSWPKGYHPPCPGPKDTYLFIGKHRESMSELGPAKNSIFSSPWVETIEVSKCDHGGNSSTDPPESSWPDVHTAPEGRKLPTAWGATLRRNLRMSSNVKYTNGPYPSMFTM